MPLGLLPYVKETTNIPQPPINWTGSIPEWNVYWALIQLGLKDGIDFIYQSAQMGGRLSLGGVVLDFFFPSLGMAINVQSTYYHYRTTSMQARGEIQRAQVEGMGIRLLYVQEEDVARNPIFYVRKALSS